MDGWWLLTVHGWVVWAQVISWPMKCPISAMSKRTISSCWPLVQVAELEGKTARKNWQRNGPRQIGDMMIWRPKHQDIFNHDTYTCFIFDDLNLNIYIYEYIIYIYIWKYPCIIYIIIWMITSIKTSTMPHSSISPCPGGPRSSYLSEHVVPLLFAGHRLGQFSSFSDPNSYHWLYIYIPFIKKKLASH